MSESAERRIVPADGVIVHGALVRQDERGSWWALGDDQRVMFAVDSDDLLLQIARARNIDVGVERLREDLAQALATENRRRAEDALWKNRSAHG